MQIETINNKDRILINIEGEINLYNCPPIKELLVNLSARNPRHVIINLEKVSYMDSTGLGCFIGGHDALKRRGGRLEIINPVGGVARLFRMTGLMSYFGIMGGETGSTPDRQSGSSGPR